MTWAEFKRKMEERGVRDDDEIAYIDIGSGYEIDINRDPETQQIRIIE